MPKRVLVLGAGTGASNNLIRSLKAGDPSLFVIGANDDRFALKKSISDRHYLTTKSSHPRFLDGLRQIADSERVDLIIPGSDSDVTVLSDLRDQFSGRVFLPQKSAVQLCQDKYELTEFLRGRAVPAPATVPVASLDDLEDVFRRLGPAERLWCRIRTGTGSMGATGVRTVEQARGWISYWEDMRGVPATSFTLSEYLPGRDFACQSVWKNGAVIAMKCCERLAYYGGAHRASGVSSTPSLAKTVHDSRVGDVCVAAVRAVDDDASGVFAVDLKENRDGVPCVTEINAGRFFMITNIFDLTGRVNLATLYVRLATGERVDPVVDDDVQEHYLVRDLDTVPGIFPLDAVFEGIREVRG
jgi:carbamoyl-phosphate synthase large subunit